MMAKSHGRGMVKTRACGSRQIGARVATSEVNLWRSCCRWPGENFRLRHVKITLSIEFAWSLSASFTSIPRESNTFRLSTGAGVSKFVAELLVTMASVVMSFEKSCSEAALHTPPHFPTSNTELHTVTPMQQMQQPARATTGEGQGTGG